LSTVAVIFQVSVRPSVEPKFKIRIRIRIRIRIGNEA
jgi:hypothetical protein